MFFQQASDPLQGGVEMNTLILQLQIGEAELGDTAGGSLVLLRLQQFQIDLTDALQGFLELVIVAQPLLHDWIL
jgi:hypothetical protein